jgi:hypothetical protein
MKVPAYVPGRRVLSSYIDGGRKSMEPSKIRANRGGYLCLIRRLTRVELGLRFVWLALVSDSDAGGDGELQPWN